MNKRAVVAGATGLIGRELVAQLLREERYDKVVALVRKPLELTHIKLEQRLVDYERLAASVEGTLAGADVYCALGTTIKTAGSQAAFRKVDYDYPLALARLAAAEGAAAFLIVTAMGANARSAIFYSRVKGELEEALGGLGLASLTIFRPSLLVGERAEFRRGERFFTVAMKALQGLLIGPLRKYRAIRAERVAAGMRAAAAKPRAGIAIYATDQIETLADAATGGQKRDEE